MRQNLCNAALSNNAYVLYEDNDCIAYLDKNNYGELEIREYNIFTGIWLIYKDVHTREYRYPSNYPSGLLEIAYCEEGRLEYDAGDRFFYLSKGDMSINKTIQTAIVSCPTQHYRGVSVIIDPNIAPKCLSCFLDDVNIRPDALMAKFCSENHYFIMRSIPRLEHIFAELYSAPCECRIGFYKVKILEILLFLNSLDKSLSQTDQHSYSKIQVELAKEITEFIVAHFNVRLTVQQLSKALYISPAQLRKCVCDVYGQSVYAYIKACKMRSAAQRLRTTDQTISEIADALGYTNNSKFSKAFKDIMNVSPTEYRRNCAEKIFLEHKRTILE